MNHSYVLAVPVLHVGVITSGDKGGDGRMQVWTDPLDTLGSLMKAERNRISTWSDWDTSLTRTPLKPRRGERLVS